MAWLQVALAQLIIFNTCYEQSNQKICLSIWHDQFGCRGFINSFGLFENYYVSTMHLGNLSQVAWIGSLQVFLLFGLGTFSGRLTVSFPDL